MVLFQKPFHLLDELLCVVLRLLVLGAQAENLLIEVGLQRINSHSEALFVQLLLDLEIALISLFIMDVLVDEVVDEGDLRLNYLSHAHYLLSELLEALQPPPRSIKNGLGDEHVRIAHKFFILAYLVVQQVWEYVTRYKAVLLDVLRRRYKWRFGLHVLPPIIAIALEADPLSHTHLSFQVSSAYTNKKLNKMMENNSTILTACRLILAVAHLVIDVPSRFDLFVYLFLYYINLFNTLNT